MKVKTMMKGTNEINYMNSLKKCIIDIARTFNMKVIKINDNEIFNNNHDDDAKHQRS